MINFAIDIKRIRAEVIKEYLDGKQCFCFSCGNSSLALRQAGADVIGISPHNALSATTYITPQKAQAIFKCFNATSGCLPLFLMEKIAHKVRNQIPKKMFASKKTIYVPTGSGETLFTFSYIFPVRRLVGVIDKDEKAMNFTPKFSTLYSFINTNYKLIKKSNMPFDGYRIIIVDYRKSDV